MKVHNRSYPDVFKKVKWIPDMDLTKRKSEKNMKKNIKDISDFEGHYDLDGVSFEKGLGVIVASEAIKTGL